MKKAACGGSDSRMGLPLHRTTIVLSVTCAEQILKHFYERCILGGTYFLLIHTFSSKMCYNNKKFSLLSGVGTIFSVY